MIGTILTHKEDALRRLMQQFKNRENLLKILEIYLKQVQAFENALFPALEKLNIDLMEGQWLDWIGAIVVEGRPNGMSDADYRIRLKAKIGTNVSEAEPERIISIFKLLTMSVWVHYLNLGNGNLALEGTAEFADQDAINALFEAMERVIGGGIRLAFFVCAPEDGVFACDGGGPAAAVGFDDGTGLVGGKLATAYIRRKEFAFANAAGEVNPGQAGFGAGSADPFAGGFFLE